MIQTRTVQHSLLLLLISTALLQFAVRPADAVADRSLYLTIDKAILPLGQEITITVHIGKESCKEHGHFLDIYIYDSADFLVRRYYVEKSPEIPLHLEDFPISIRCSPPKVDVYTVKLWVQHGQWSRSWYLEDTIMFRVIPYVATTQTTTLPTTASVVFVTRTIMTTTTTSATVSITTEEKEFVKVDWVAILILLVGVAIALSIFAAFEIGKKKGKESRELHRLPLPPKVRRSAHASKT